MLDVLCWGVVFFEFRVGLWDAQLSWGKGVRLVALRLSALNCLWQAEIFIQQQSQEVGFPCCGSSWILQHAA